MMALAVSHYLQIVGDAVDGLEQMEQPAVVGGHVVDVVVDSEGNLLDCSRQLAPCAGYNINYNMITAPIAVTLQSIIILR